MNVSLRKKTERSPDAPVSPSRLMRQGRIIALGLLVATAFSACGRTPSADAAARESGDKAEKSGDQRAANPAREAEGALEGSDEGGRQAPVETSTSTEAAPQGTAAQARPATVARQPWLVPWLARADVRLPKSRSPTPRLVSRRRGSKATAALRLGRKGVWLYDRLVLPLDCRRWGRPCGSRRGRDEVLSFQRRDLGAATAEGPRSVPRLGKACRHLKGREVVLLADRAVRVGTLLQTMATLREVGALPVLAGADDAGVVVMWPADAPRDEGVPRRASAGEPVPADVQGLTVELSPDAATVVLQREAGGYMRRPVAEPPWAAIALWAARLAAKAKPVRVGLLAAKPDVSVGRLARAIEAMMAPCQTSACARPSRRLASWQLVGLVAGAAAGEVDPPQMPEAVLQTKQATTKIGRVPDLIHGAHQRPGRPALLGHRVDLSRRPDAPQARLHDPPVRLRGSSGRRPGGRVNGLPGRFGRQRP